MSQLLVIALLAGIFFIGSYIEKSHYASIEKRERQYRTPLLMTHCSKFQKPISDTRLVAASVVIGADHFKHVLGNLLQVFGGNLAPYESVLDRARREALLRLREQAPDFDAILNVKLETCILSKVTRKQGSPKAAVIAYGTAVKYQ